MQTPVNNANIIKMTTGCCEKDYCTAKLFVQKCFSQTFQNINGPKMSHQTKAIMVCGLLFHK